MPKSSFKVDTVKTRADLQKLIAKSPSMIGAALYEEIKEVEVPEVKANTPVEKGNLRDTVDAWGPYFSGAQIIVRIVAGTTPETAEYAWIVHEDPDAVHPVGDWKYIENPMREAAPHIPRRVAARVNDKLEDLL